MLALTFIIQDSMMENAEEGMQSFPMGGQMAIKHWPMAIQPGPDC